MTAITDAGLTIAATFVPWSLSRSRAEKNPSLNWRITLQHKGRDVLTCDYSAGCGHSPAHNRTFATDYEKRTAIRQECETGYATKGALIAYQFRQGPKIEPDARDVINSIILDGSAINSPFTDWAADYGYSTDSIAARAAYDQCLAHGVALRAAVGPSLFDALLEEANA